jgi:type III pantothenate kinase
MLLFDAGNSRCKWAWIESGVWVRQGVVDNNNIEEWKQLKQYFSTLASPHKIFVSNVAGNVLTLKLQELCSLWECSMQVISAEKKQCGVLNLYEQPDKLGSDRWAALIAAWHHEHAACLVVNCGTATTVDALSSMGEFIGGIILPGIDLIQRSLLEGTAQLEIRKGMFFDFPKNTADAIMSGALLATLGVIQHQYSKLAPNNNVRCIIGGGAANELLTHLKLPYVQMDNPVLQGMQIIGQACCVKNKKETVA